jgi:hypothetical protein
MLAEAILLRRLIRSLKDRHSMVPGGLRQLRFETFFEKKECLVPVFVEKDFREHECLLWTEIQHERFDVHPSTSYLSLPFPVSSGGKPTPLLLETRETI